ncbi:apolipoprotein A-Ib [Astyanax mexicanus]|uniref:apolipoprotein A-Ib n=1 Tax=Astyanax mexicanus TaxID=7994 RepID=UPI0020CAC985|nr:apolipoprotein A-Ib [Astyanax mexicanus]
MRFVALALTILLAAGCQARYMQADAPTDYEQIRSAVVTYLGQVKETAQKAIDRLDDGDYKEVKERLTLSLQRIQGYLEAASTSLAPVRETIGPQVVEGVIALRAKVEKDVEDLRKELEPKREELRQVVKKHLDEYREKLEPLIKEFTEKHREQMEQLRVKMEPVMKDLQERIKTNLEETKSKLTPIVEVLRSKATERVEELRQFVAPYVQEYRDHAQSVFGQLQSKYESGELQKKLATVGEEIKPQLEKIVETLQKAFMA